MVVMVAACSSSTGSAPSVSEAAIPASLAGSVPPGAPPEDIKYVNEWPSPNGGLYNTRVATSGISAANVAKLAIAWTLPLTASGASGRDVANPVIANGVAYLQDGMSNVTAVNLASG